MVSELLLVRLLEVSSISVCRSEGFRLSVYDFKKESLMTDASSVAFIVESHSYGVPITESESYFRHCHRVLAAHPHSEVAPVYALDAGIDRESKRSSNFGVR